MIVTYMLMLVGLAIIWSSAYAYAQVSVQQSQSSSMNGNLQSVETLNGKTVVTTAHGILNIAGDKIMYCQDLKHNGNLETCGPQYTLNSDGTITQVK